jgi:hypothetical protein
MKPHLDRFIEQGWREYRERVAKLFAEDGGP